MLIHPAFVTDLAGFALLVAGMVYLYTTSKKKLAN